MSFHICLRMWECVRGDAFLREDDRAIGKRVERHRRHILEAHSTETNFGAQGPAQRVSAEGEQNKLQHISSIIVQQCVHKI